MLFEGIIHRCGNTDCYARNENELVINISTNKRITAVNLIHEDPYINGPSECKPWYGTRDAMHIARELKESYIWTISVFPKFKRQQYYFEVICGEEIRYLFEDGLYTTEEMNLQGMFKQYFKYAWMNPSDIYRAPKWVEDTFWYQIMPDRFCREGNSASEKQFADWNDCDAVNYTIFYGGNFAGIISKLAYLKELGINGIYLTPIFESPSNHKYNTTDYQKIDSDFGTEQEFKELVDTAHSLGIRVMIDAVFNHSGTDFFAWKDVLEKGKASKYFDWFFVDDDNQYFSFAFVKGMPKLNTNNPEVASYFCDACKEWIAKWNVDGIRFDVGNEIAHSFIKRLHKEIKSINPEIYLLGEIWHDAYPWLQGDEYDSVMNYPFMESVNNFFVNKRLTSRDFMYMMNRCYSLYMEHVNKVLFNFLDTHDVGRVYSRFQDEDIFFQHLVLLVTMPGSPCIYYGTELEMEGDCDPYNRCPMPWNEIESGEKTAILNEVKTLIMLRRNYAELKGNYIEWKCGEDRLINYVRPGDIDVEVYINADEKDKQISLEGQEVLYARGYSEGTLAAGGSLIVKGKPDGYHEAE